MAINYNDLLKDPKMLQGLYNMLTSNTLSNIPTQDWANYMGTDARTANLVLAGMADVASLNPEIAAGNFVPEFASSPTPLSDPYFESFGYDPELMLEDIQLPQVNSISDAMSKTPEIRQAFSDFDKGYVQNIADNSVDGLFPSQGFQHGERWKNLPPAAASADAMMSQQDELDNLFARTTMEGNAIDNTSGNLDISNRFDAGDPIGPGKFKRRRF